MTGFISANTIHPPCLLTAWSIHEAELRDYVRHRLNNRDDAADVLHDVFVKALQYGQQFCQVTRPRAWLFQVVRHALIDYFRAHRALLPLPDDLPAPDVTQPPVEQLTQCLPRVLAELTPADRVALIQCDLDGLPQQVFADRMGISLPAAKSRIQRARTRLRQRLIDACQVHFDATGRVCCFVPRDNF